jgi:hypothetical protein
LVFQLVIYLKHANIFNIDVHIASNNHWVRYKWYLILWNSVVKWVRWTIIILHHNDKRTNILILLVNFRKSYIHDFFCGPRAINKGPLWNVFIFPIYVFLCEIINLFLWNSCIILVLKIALSSFKGYDVVEFLCFIELIPMKFIMINNQWMRVTS